MRQYGLRTKRDAVNLALRTLAVEPMTLEEALAMQGTGWDGDLDEMRVERASGSLRSTTTRGSEGAPE